MEIADLLAGLPADVPGPTPGLLVPDLPPADLASLFGERLRSVDGHDHGPLPGSAAVEIVVSILLDHGVDEYLGWDDPGLPGIHRRLQAAGIRRVEASVPERGENRRAHQQGYLTVQGGVTGADAGLAESGSIVLRSGPGRPRLSSLIPSTHVAVLPVTRLVRSLAHFAAQHPAAPGGISNLVFITGPSRTGDIEQELNLGVHGPRNLHVILVN
ncbi:MAG: lactate utilization protein [Acidimicrobiia bacterium]|nr:lactate utilization protein [Acidimicrobiia bacterium]